jgi:hypothetical protein
MEDEIDELDILNSDQELDGDDGSEGDNLALLDSYDE